MTHVASSTAGRGGLSTTERALRAVLGVGAILAGLSMWVTSGGLLPWVGVAVALLGLDFVVTGIRGYCPLYARLGIGQSWPRPMGSDRGTSSRRDPSGDDPPTPTDATHCRC